MRLNRRACNIHLGKGWLAGRFCIQEQAKFFEDGDFVDFDHLDPSFVRVVDVGAVNAGVVAHVQRLVAVAAESKALFVQGVAQRLHATDVKPEVHDACVCPNAVLKQEASFLSMACTNSMRVGPIKEANPPVPGLDGTRITRR